MSTREFRPRVVLRNSIHPSRASTAKLNGFVLATALAITGCKAEESAPTNPEPPKVAAAPRASHAALPIPPVSPDPPAPADVATPPPDAEKTASGLVMKVEQPGSGTERVQPGQVFVISFAMWDRAGKPMGHLQHAELNMNALAPGWAEAIVFMAPGETRRLWVPADLTRKPDVPNPRPKTDHTVDLTLEYIGRLRMNAQGAPVMLAAIPPADSAHVTSAGSANGQPASSASAAPKKKH
jgi:hypothetical protein